MSRVDRILIVDDSLTVRMDLAEALEEAGFVAHPCADLGEARRELARTRCALLVLDLVLPDGDGLELLDELRASPQHDGLPVILLSSRDEVADRIRGLGTGADAYLGKPYDAAQLVRRARALIERRRPSVRRAAARVLLIDDSRTVREQFGAVLRDAGYEVVDAASGEEGLQLAADLRPDAVVVDYVMPGLDGVAVIRSIRLDPALQTTPCLLLTGSRDESGEVAALDSGADAYVLKSEDVRVVLARLEAILRSARGSREQIELGGSLHAPRTILAVDDSATYLDALAGDLRDAGYEVIKASSGEQALALLEVETVDGILLDLEMPGLGGIETCRRIKASRALRDIPLVVLTARDDDASLIESINAGADDFVAKAADLSALQARLRAQLRRKHFEDENRRINEQLLRRETETRAAQELATARQLLLDELAAKNDALARHSHELEALNRELEMYAYSISHDLRAPLRTIDGFGRALLERLDGRLDERERHLLDRTRLAAARMSAMIDGLLVLSRVNRRELGRVAVRLDDIAHRVFEGLRELEPGREVELELHRPLEACADPALIESALENLLGNAWKFTAGRQPARIVVGSAPDPADRHSTCFFVRDNGAGFDARYADKLFAPFQRLHPACDYEGTGIGLATVQRIVHRHGGHIRAEARPGQGATFYFTLPPARP